MINTTTYKEFLKSTSGSVITLAAIVAPLTIGFTALGVETAVWYTQRATLQTAADAAALAGAYELRAGKDTAQVGGAAGRQGVQGVTGAPPSGSLSESENRQVLELAAKALWGAGDESVDLIRGLRASFDG